jgi:hypothetical protein
MRIKKTLLIFAFPKKLGQVAVFYNFFCRFKDYKLITENSELA